MRSPGEEEFTVIADAPAPADDPPPSEHDYEVMIWHDIVHEQLEDLRLVFFRLSFTPSYERDRILETLQGVYETLGISSYIAYETLGEYDLLVRLWLPARHEPEAAELVLWDALKDLRLWNINHFRGRTAKHRAQGEQPDLNSPPTDKAVLEVNAFNAAQGEFTAVPRSDLIEELIAERWIAPVRTDARGIRFYITFDHPAGGGLSPPRREAVLGLVREKCAAVEREWAGWKGVSAPQISIYSGGGSMTDFLIMARAPHPRFHQFVRDLVHGLRSSELGSLYGIRPYTHVIADRMFTAFQECRPVGAGEPLQVDPDAPEGESLEYKATLGLDLRSLVAVGRYEPDARRTRAVARAVCGMLNSPGGGRVVIGVLETQRESEHHRDPEELLRALASGFGYEPRRRRRSTPAGRLPNAVLGVEAEIGKERTYPDQDTYLLRLTEALRTEIEPVPLPWLQIDFVAVEDRTVCVVSARPADKWFYARSEDRKHLEFMVREAASTRAYEGGLADGYKRTHPRGDG